MDVDYLTVSYIEASKNFLVSWHMRRARVRAIKKVVGAYIYHRGYHRIAGAYVWTVQVGFAPGVDRAKAALAIGAMYDFYFGAVNVPPSDEPPRVWATERIEVRVGVLEPGVPR